MAGPLDDILRQIYGLQMPRDIRMGNAPQMPLGPTPLAEEAPLPMDPAMTAPPTFMPAAMPSAPAMPGAALPTAPPTGMFGTPQARPAVPAPVADSPLAVRFNEVYNAGGLSQTEEVDPAARPMLRAQPLTMPTAVRPDPRMQALAQRAPRFAGRMQQLQQMRAARGM
jgi:hypothetical protein